VNASKIAQTAKSPMKPAKETESEPRLNELNAFANALDSDLKTHLPPGGRVNCELDLFRIAVVGKLREYDFVWQSAEKGVRFCTEDGTVLAAKCALPRRVGRVT